MCRLGPCTESKACGPFAYWAGVYRDNENPSRLFFYEQWTDKQAINVHFAQTSSQTFVAAIRKLAVDAPKLEIFLANKLS
jgi:quinol monooxygenase YgiN